MTMFLKNAFEATSSLIGSNKKDNGCEMACNVAST